MGKYSLDTTAKTDCLVCPQGQAFFSTSKPCIKCPKGTYLIGTSCVLCSSKMYQNQIDQTSINACKNCTLPGYYCPAGATAENLYPCMAGKYSLVAGANESDCSVCSAGRFSSSNGTGSCENCKLGKFIVDREDAKEHDSENDCQSCPSLIASGGIGYGYVNRENVCTICAQGRYLIDFLPTSETYPKCIDCNGGRYNSQEGKTSVFFCKSCKTIGTYSINGSSTCTNCPGGYYSDIQNSPACINCNNGQYNADRGDNVEKHDSIEDCETCEAGKVSRPGDIFW